MGWYFILFSIWLFIVLKMNWNHFGNQAYSYPPTTHPRYPPSNFGNGFGWAGSSQLPMLPGLTVPTYPPPPSHMPPTPPYIDNYNPYNPLHSMLVYQTNNYYGGSYQN